MANVSARNPTAAGPTRWPRRVMLIVGIFVSFALIGGFFYTFVPRLALADILPDMRLRTCLAAQLKIDSKDPVSPAQLNSVRWLTCGDPTKVFSRDAYPEFTSERDSVDLTGIESLPSLTGLDLSNTEIDDFRPLTHLPHLQFLNLANVPIVNWSDVGKLTTLRRLNLRMPYWTERESSSLLGLRNLSNLRWLDVSFSGVASLDGLEGTNLEQLDALGDPVSDLTPLAGLSELRSLSLNGTDVSDLTPLGNLVDLEFVVLQQTQVSDLAPLANCHRLKAIDVRSTQVTDISPVKDVPLLMWDGE